MSLFETMKGIKLPTTDEERNELVITEGSNGFWNYHLSRRANHMRALCGTATLPTALPVSAWDAPAEAGLPKTPTYCEKCARLAWPEKYAS